MLTHGNYEHIKRLIHIKVLCYIVFNRYLISKKLLADRMLQNICVTLVYNLQRN